MRTQNHSVGSFFAAFVICLCRNLEVRCQVYLLTCILDDPKMDLNLVAIDLYVVNLSVMKNIIELVAAAGSTCL